MGTIIAIYTFLVLYFLITHNYLLALIVAPTIFIYFIVRKILKEKHVKNMKIRIAKAQEDFRNDIQFEPFLNINKEPWQVLELLPGVTRAQAKNLAMQIREIRNVKEFDEFRRIVGLDKALCEVNKKIVKFN
ncbi:MAG: FUSC family protein [Candidatus Gastranaerophilales bacterium]|nr:FUSC family protein [Candidatus Gastranaerophilales bacterium]